MQMHTRSRALHLEAWAREELAAQQRTLACLDRQIAALRANDHDGFEVALADLLEETEAAPARAARCHRLVDGFAQALGVPSAHLTLGSLIERLGENAGDLAELREELRSGAARVTMANRKVRRMTSALRDLNRDLLAAVLGPSRERALREEGVLLDAEA